MFVQPVPFFFVSNLPCPRMNNGLHLPVRFFFSDWPRRWLPWRLFHCIAIAHFNSVIRRIVLRAGFEVTAVFICLRWTIVFGGFERTPQTDCRLFNNAQRTESLKGERSVYKLDDDDNNLHLRAAVVINKRSQPLREKTWKFFEGEEAAHEGCVLGMR